MPHISNKPTHQATLNVVPTKRETKGGHGEQEAAVKEDIHHYNEKKEEEEEEDFQQSEGSENEMETEMLHYF